MTLVVDSLRNAIGAANVLTAASDTAPYVQDWRGRYRGNALCVVRPASAEEAAAVVNLCHRARVAMVPQGGNTGLCGGATPVGGEVVISLARLNRLRQVDTDNNTLTVEAGCTLHALQEAAAAVDRMFPLSIASEGSATIGGCLSTNAGGIHVLRYGNMRDLTLGLEVVLPDGRIWNGLRALRKDNSGYDIKHLFIGAEGTLGLITAAVVKLFPASHSTACAWVALRSPSEAIHLLRHLQSRIGDRLSAFELMDGNSLRLVEQHISGVHAPLSPIAPWQVLLELSDTVSNESSGFLASALAGFDKALGVVIARNEKQRLAFWRLREVISEAQRREGFSVKHDISVPVSKVAEFISSASAAVEAVYADIRIVCFGHAGDGNLHYNLSMPSAASNDEFIEQGLQANRIVYDIVHSFGGSISAEHGLGQLKREEIKQYKSEIEFSLMKSIKRGIDPYGLMNPGKVI